MGSDRVSSAKVGVCMPAYNQGKYIDEALDSLRSQTFQDFVVHIVDDGSTDNLTPAKLSSIKYDKAKVFHNSENKGVVYRQNEHYKLLDCDYIVILCADDKIAPTFLEETVSYLEANSEYGAVATNLRHFGAREDIYEFDESKMKLPEILVGNRLLGSSLMRKAALDTVDLTGAARYQDWERWIGMLDNGWKLGLIHKPLFYYRRHSESLSVVASVEDELSVRRRLYTKYRHLFDMHSEYVYLNLEKKVLELINYGHNRDKYIDELERINRTLKKSKTPKIGTAAKYLPSDVRRFLKKVLNKK